MKPGIYEQHDLADLASISTQVCIIGSGCGGATLAKKLSDQGIDVIVLEQGGYFPAAKMDQNELNMAGKLYAEHGFESAGDGGNMLLYGNNVGGASVHYWADSYRTPEEKLQAWASRYGIEHHALADLAPFFEEIEANLSIHEAQDEYFNPLNKQLHAASQRLGWHGHRVPQARKFCQKSGHCMQGCVYNAKQSQMITHLPQAIQNGAKVFANSRAENFITEGNKVKQLRVSLMDQKTGQATPHTYLVNASVFVVAAGGFNSSFFLLKQGLQTRLSALGKHFSMNPSAMVHALFDETIVQWRNIPAAWGVDEYRLSRFHNEQYVEGGYLLMPNQLHPGTLAATLPLKGVELAEWMGRLPQIGGLVAWIDDVESELGEIRINSNGKRQIFYPYGEQTQATLKDSLKKQIKLLFTMGAKKLVVAGHQAITLTSERDVNKLDSLIIDAGGLLLASPHPGGGCRMGPDPQTSVVDSSHRVHGWSNLFVSDSSVFPTSSSLDPSLTIMAFSYVAAKSIQEHYF